MNKKIVTVTVIIGVLVVVGLVYSAQTRKANGPEQEPITQNGGIDTSNWQTYRNEELGFEFKYPEDWMYNDNISYAVVGFRPVKPQPGSPDYTYLQVNVFESVEQNLEDFYLSSEKVAHPGGKSLFYDYKPEEISTSVGKVYLFDKLPGVTPYNIFVIEKDNKVYQILRINDLAYRDTIENIDDIVNKIIGTLKII